MSEAGFSALVTEAAAKSDLLWIRPPGPPISARTAGSLRAWPAWHVWSDGAAYVVSGPGEQELPVLAGPVDLILRSKDTGARLLTLRAEAEAVPPLDPAWAEVAALLKASRLNAPDPDSLLDRWAQVNTITRLRPTGGVVESPHSPGPAYDEASGAAPPAPTSATTSGWAPWHARGRRNTRRMARKLDQKGAPPGSDTAPPPRAPSN